MVEEPRSSEEWISILKLASKWEFQSLQKRAISEVDNIATPIEKVTLGRDYDIPELRLPAYVDLCKSIVPLTEEDGELLGLRDVIKIYRVRQELWGQDINTISSEDILAKVRINFLPLCPSPPAPARSDSSPPVRLPSPPPADRSDPSPPPQIPVRPPSPPPLNWPPSPRLMARKDSPKPTKQEDLADKSEALEAAERNRTPSPATSVEVHPITPPSLPQSTQTMVFVPPDVFVEPDVFVLPEKLDRMAEPVITTKLDRAAEPVMTTKLDRTAEPVTTTKLDRTAEPVMTTKLGWTTKFATTTTMLPSAQGDSMTFLRVFCILMVNIKAGPSVSLKSKKQKQPQPPPNPPGTGKKAKKRAAAEAAMAAIRNGTAHL